MEASGVVRSLDAEASASISSVEIEDFVQTFGDESRYMLRCTVPDSGRGEEPVLSGKVHVWNGKSPDRDGLDVYLESTLAQLKVAPNLETLGVIQTCVAEALEAGILRAAQLREAEGRGAVGEMSAAAVSSPLPATPMHMAASAMTAAGSAVVHAGMNTASSAVVVKSVLSPGTDSTCALQ